MKKLFSLFAAFLFVGSMWADTTATWTVSAGDLGSGIGSGTFTDNKSNTWSYTRTLKEGDDGYTGSITSGYLQIGKNGVVENLTFSTSDITGTIKSVSVDCASYKGNHNITITVGTTSYLSKTAVPAWSGSAGDTKTGTGTSKGTITISITDGTRAFYIKSITVIYDATSAVANPQFSPAGGTYIGSQTVEISSETEGATIYYTTNGDTPTESSTEYSTAITVSETMTIKAIAMKDGMDNSAVASATYTIETLDGDGSEQNPYTVHDINLLNTTQSGKYVIGYIVGCASSGGGKAASTTNTNIALGDSTTQTTNLIPVEVPTSIRSTLNVQDNPSNIGKKVKVHGNLTTYFGVLGVKGTDSYEFVETPTDIEETVDSSVKSVKFIQNGQLFIEKNGHIYNAMGQMVK